MYPFFKKILGKKMSYQVSKEPSFWVWPVPPSGGNYLSFQKRMKGHTLFFGVRKGLHSGVQVTLPLFTIAV